MNCCCSSAVLVPIKSVRQLSALALTSGVSRPWRQTFAWVRFAHRRNHHGGKPSRFVPRRNRRCRYSGPSLPCPWLPPALASPLPPHGRAGRRLGACAMAVLRGSASEYLPVSFHTSGIIGIHSGSSAFLTGRTSRGTSRSRVFWTTTGLRSIIEPMPPPCGTMPVPPPLNILTIEHCIEELTGLGFKLGRKWLWKSMLALMIAEMAVLITVLV